MQQFNVVRNNIHKRITLKKKEMFLMVSNIIIKLMSITVPSRKVKSLRNTFYY